MNDASASLIPPDEHDWSRPLAERQLQMLGELAEIGLECARHVERQTRLEGEAAPPVADIALAYSRVSRAVRLTIVLQSRLIEAIKAQATAAEQALVHDEQLGWFTRQIRVEDAVKRIARAEDRGEAEAERLAREAGERLEDDDLYGDLMDAPFDQILARICDDLGLDAPPTSPTQSVAGGGPPAAERAVEGAGGAHAGETSPFWASFLPEDSRRPSASDSS